MAAQDSLLNVPIGDDYVDESTEWTPLTRRSAAARAYTPVPVSRRTGLIAGGVVLAGGGLGVIGVSALALTVGLVAGAIIAADRLAPPAGPVAHHMPDAEVYEGVPVRVDDKVAAAALPAEAPVASKATPARSSSKGASSKSSSRRSSRSLHAAPTRTRTAPGAQAPAAPAHAPSRPAHTAPPAPETASHATAPPAPAAPSSYAAVPPAQAPAPSAYAAPPSPQGPVASSTYAEAPAAAPPAQTPAAPAAYAPAAPAAAPEQDSWLAQAAQAAGDLLAGEEEDPLDDLVAVLGRDPSPAPTPADDGMDDLLAGLDDERLPTAPAPVGRVPVAPVAHAPTAQAAAEDDLLADLDEPIPTAPVPVAPAAPGVEEDGMDALLADLDAEPLPTAPAPVGPAPVEEDAGWMASASSLVGAVMDTVASSDGVAVAEPMAVAATTGWTPAPSGPAAVELAPEPGPEPPLASSYAAPPAAAPAAPVAAPQAPAAAPPVTSVAPPVAPEAAAMGFTQAPAAAYAPPPPPPPRCVGELCGDDDAMGYRDEGNVVDLLENHSEDWTVSVRDADVASQFAGSGGGFDDVDDLDALDSVVVEIRTDEPGVSVEIDGTYAGVTPLLVDVSNGYHGVKLTLGDASQRFELQPQKDPDAWCFDMKGRTFKIDRCR